jgi:hypothetical protein
MPIARKLATTALVLTTLAAPLGCRAEAPPPAAPAAPKAAPPAPPTPPPAPRPTPTPDPPANAPPEDTASAKEPEPKVHTDTEILAIYREVYCLQRRGDQASILELWEAHGLTSETWAQAMRKAARRAVDDPNGFGAGWAEIADTPCP